MKIARCSFEKVSSWGIVDVEEGLFRPFRGQFSDWAVALTNSEGDTSLRVTGERWSLKEVRFLPPAERSATVYVAGANYLKHLVEFGLAAPASPFAFLKPYRALTGAYDEIPYCEMTRQLDFEVELVAVVGRPLTDAKSGLDCVLGYTIGNDISARDLQAGPGGRIGMDFLSGKGLDHSTPLGPWIVTRDEFGDASPKLQLQLKVNDELRQDANTQEMRWDVAELLQFVNARVRLEPGDILFTGSPAGVAQGDGRFLSPGDQIDTVIERIGSMRNVVGSKPS
jgi:2-keto-4-pentenoate hydratase/2-oxohepta-3-ene-1,7-dioic acid hydratase in catechol pathway